MTASSPPAALSLAEGVLFLGWSYLVRWKPEPLHSQCELLLRRLEVLKVSSDVVSPCPREAQHPEEVQAGSSDRG